MLLALVACGAERDSGFDAAEDEPSIGVPDGGSEVDESSDGSSDESDGTSDEGSSGGEDDDRDPRRPAGGFGCQVDLGFGASVEASLGETLEDVDCVVQAVTSFGDQHTVALGCGPDYSVYEFAVTANIPLDLPFVVDQKVRIWTSEDASPSDSSRSFVIRGQSLEPLLVWVNEPDTRVDFSTYLFEFDVAESSCVPLEVQTCSEGESTLRRGVLSVEIDDESSVDVFDGGARTISGWMTVVVDRAEVDRSKCDDSTLESALRVLLVAD